MLDWNDNWRTELARENESCYIRLCECRNTRRDVYAIASLMCKYNSDRLAEECLNRTIEWIVDWNNQFNLNLSNLEYKRYLNRLERVA